MIEFPDYYRATNAAYITLLKYKEFSFPIGIFHIFKSLNNVKLYTYDQLMTRFGISSENFFPSSDYGYNICDLATQRYIVAYNSEKAETCIRFTLAHELGHIVLKHREDGDVENKEANCFARNYLCPIPVVKEMDLCSINDYTELFYVSEPMTKVSIDFKNCDLRNISTNTFNTYNDSVMLAMNGITPIDLYGYNYGYYL